MRKAFERWLGENGFESVEAIRGLKDASHADNAAAVLRSQYLTAVNDDVPGKLVL